MLNHSSAGGGRGLQTACWTVLVTACNSIYNNDSVSVVSAGAAHHLILNMASCEACVSVHPAAGRVSSGRAATKASNLLNFPYQGILSVILFSQEVSPTNAPQKPSKTQSIRDRLVLGLAPSGHSMKCSPEAGERGPMRRCVREGRTLPYVWFQDP